MGAVAQKAKKDIPYLKGYAALKFSGEVLDSVAEGIPLEQVVSKVKPIVENYLEIYRALGGLSAGVPKEILMSTTKYFILVRLFYRTETYHVAVLDSKANLGYTRFVLFQLNKELKG
ncbi:hypothetical protein [Thermovibrio ammonificans]|jgi:hypothetical protein|uniref:Uncharacterized protein n=1 Tax=Thermovibrio ammonificans (strain DSM 15698 / JCM 12110 / HB-1) TaxID=648996 RepID=E8T5L8_THEA1|nr:hypothetical protein [Thermovibrio ammonificans]ADU96493.1 hypothetical protein Theam_0521 [Thermovibrio ammonificans HB-1]